MFIFDLRKNQLINFPYADQGALVIRTTHHLKKVKVTQDVQVTITSASSERLGPEDYQQTLRGHWKIETTSHFVRDVTFAEDHCLAHTGHLPQNLAALRNLVRGIASLCVNAKVKSKGSIAAFRRATQHDPNFLAQLLTRPLCQQTP